MTFYNCVVGGENHEKNYIHVDEKSVKKSFKIWKILEHLGLENL